MKTTIEHEPSDNYAGRTMRHTLKGPLAYATGLLLPFLLSASVTAAPVGVGGKPSVDTMNINLYVGSDIGRVLALNPSDPLYLQKLVGTVKEVFDTVVTSQPATRMGGVADRIAARMPHLVAVQEASLIRNQSPGDLVVGGSNPATDVVYDYLAILLDALKAHGAHYAVAASTEEVDVEMPMLNLQTGKIDDVRLIDRDAILVRTDLPPGQLRVSNPQGGHFTSMIVLPTLSVPRGWCSVDVALRGEKFRYLCAHLEEETQPEIQMGQAIELIEGPANVRMPVILSGDFNADVLHRNGVETYDAFVAAGFEDAWAELHESNPAGGLTWGHDEFLADPSVPMIWRLDVVWYRGCGLLPRESKALGLVLNRTEARRWASDHAPVTANFKVGGLRPAMSPPHWAKFRSRFSR